MTLSEVTDEFLRLLDIHTVLPQQEPFVMVGSLVHFALETSTTETLIAPDNIFVENGCFSAFGMMENIAQTCAARIGFYNKYILLRPVEIGYIGAIREYVVHKLAPAGALLTTTVDVEEEIFGMTMASATVRCGDEVLATARIKLAVKNAA